VGKVMAQGRMKGKEKKSCAAEGVSLLIGVGSVKVNN